MSDQTEIQVASMNEAYSHLKRIIHLATVCVSYSEVDDASGFFVAGEKMVEDARAVAKLLKDIRLSFNAANTDVKAIGGE